MAERRRGPDSTIAPAGNKNRNKNKRRRKPTGNNKGNKKNPYYGGYGEYKGVKRNKAKSLVRLEINDLLNELRRERRGINREYDYGNEDSETLLQRSIGDLNHIFKESGDYIGHQNQAIAANYAGAKQENAGITQALLGTLGGNTNNSISGVDAEMARLGIQANTGGIAADGAFMGNIANVNGANEQANLSAMAAGAADIGNLLMGMNAGSRASNLGRVTNERSDQLTELQRNRNDALEELRYAMRDVRGQRGDLTRQLLEQLSQTGWDRYLQQEQLNLQKRAARPNRGGNRRAPRRRQPPRRRGGYTNNNGGNYNGGANSSFQGGGSEFGPAGKLGEQLLHDTFPRRRR